MDIITDNYDNISINQIYSKLTQKLDELSKLDEVNKVEGVSETQKDYFDIQHPTLDKQDYERVLSKFKSVDSQIRSHEQVHATIGHTTTPISYTYQKGPDGKMYAVGGSVRFDTSIPKDPKEAEIKIENIKKAAGSVSEPSGADNTIVSTANAALNKILIQNKGDQDANNK